MSRKPKKKVIRNPSSKDIPALRKLVECTEESWDADGMTARNWLFVTAYVGPAAGCASRAAEMAGYRAESRTSLATVSNRLMNTPAVIEAIRHALTNRAMTPEWAKQRLADMAKASMSNFISIDEEGKPVLDWKKAQALGAIGQIKEYDPSTGKIKLHDAGSALQDLLKLHGLLVNRTDHTTGGKPLKTYADIDDGESKPA